MATWPTYERQIGAMYVLAQHKRLGLLMNMLRSFEANFNTRFQYPIVVFNDDLSQTDKSQLRSTTRARLIFDQVDFKLPSFMDPSLVPERTECERNINRSPEGSLGYRHMCCFQAFQASSADQQAALVVPALVLRTSRQRSLFHPSRFLLRQRGLIPP